MTTISGVITYAGVPSLRSLSTFAAAEEHDQRLGELMTMVHGRGSTLPKP